MKTEEEQIAWEKNCYGMPSRLIDDLVSEDAGSSVYDAGMVLAGYLSNMQEAFCNQESEDQTKQEKRLQQDLNIAKYIIFKYIVDKERGAG